MKPGKGPLRFAPLLSGCIKRRGVGVRSYEILNDGYSGDRCVQTPVFYLSGLNNERINCNKVVLCNTFADKKRSGEMKGQ